MLSRKQISLIVSLQRKKVRDEEKLFVIEGDKIVREFLAAGYRLRLLLGKPEYLNNLTPERLKHASEVIPVSFEELRKVSSLTTPHNAMALVEIPATETGNQEIFSSLSFALDFVQDPGNLGTIIRSAAWFGIRNIVCSENCVDVYNPKVIQASMGAILNVNVIYRDLKQFLKEAVETGLPVYGTLLDGQPVYSEQLEKRAVAVLGNESRGISDELLPYITRKVSIPRLNESAYGVESLNVGMAATVFMSEFMRR